MKWLTKPLTQTTKLFLLLLFLLALSAAAAWFSLDYNPCPGESAQQLCEKARHFISIIERMLDVLMLSAIFVLLCLIFSLFEDNDEQAARRRGARRRIVGRKQ
ncbi:MAG: hypothetical protein KF823_01035 [Xanthomonadales bacterium]|nr:hypothetical protein [Xanthomonadales bacterium]